MDKKQMHPGAIKNKTSIRTVLGDYSMFIALVIIWIIFTILSKGNFVSARNISNIFRQFPIQGVLSIGMVFCLITGNLDLSVGSVAGFSGAVVAILITQLQLNPIVSMLIVLLMGCAIGSVMGWLIGYQRIPSFIVTLGGKLIFDGAMLLLLNSQSIRISNETFHFIGNDFLAPPFSTMLGIAFAVVLIVGMIFAQKKRMSLGICKDSWTATIVKGIIVAVVTFGLIYLLNLHEGVPISLILLVVLVAIFTFVLNKTRFGRNVYAVGGNKMASLLAGVNNKKTVFKTFVMVGFFASLSGLVLASRLGSAASSGGRNFEVDVISACVIGGVSLAGGRGNIIMALVGVLVITSLTIGMSLLNLTLPVQNILRGLIILAAIWFDATVRKVDA